MGLFRSTKQAAEENAFEGATDWFKRQAKTAEAFNNEDKEMGGQATPKQARIFIAIEDNDKEGMVAASLKSNSPKVMLDAFFKLAQQEQTFANLIKATAAKLEIVENMNSDTKMPAELREALEYIINIL